MIEQLSKLYNTMMTIETKGESTKQMAICLNYLLAIINEVSSQNAVEESGD